MRVPVPGSQFVFKALVEADAFLPGEGVGLMGIVGGDEVGDTGGCRRERRPLAAGNALLGQNGTPGFSESILLHFL